MVFVVMQIPGLNLIYQTEGNMSQLMVSNLKLEIFI